MIFQKIENCCDFAFSALEGMHGWAQEVIAIIIFVLVCNFFAKWVLKRLHRHFEKQKRIWADSFVKALYVPISYYVWFFAAVHVVDLISAQISHEIHFASMRMILSVGALLAFVWFIMRFKKNIINHMIFRGKTHESTLDPGKLDAIDKVLTISILFFTLLVVLELTDRSMNTIIAFGGVGGLAVAFASQEIIANFFGGFMIYLTQPFVVGDWIDIPERNIEGNVEEIGWYTTQIRTLAKRPVYVPNSTFSKLILVNPSRMSHRQFKETIGLRYADLPQLKEILAAIKVMLKDHPDVDHDQYMIVQLSSFNQYSIDILISAFTLTIDTEGFALVKEDFLFKIADIIKSHGADFAYPTHNIVMGQ